MVDLNRKIGTNLPTIPEEKCERFEGLKARDQIRQQVLTKPPETLEPSHTPERLSLEKAADGEIELRLREK